jgi:hypothetical protein
MINRDPNTRKGRVAVFNIGGGRIFTNLITEWNYAHTAGLPTFSHWGTPEFTIDLTPHTTPQEAA